MEVNDDAYLALLQIWSMPLEPGLPHMVILLFRRSKGGMMSKNRAAINCNYEEDKHYTLKMAR